MSKLTLIIFYFVNYIIIGLGFLSFAQNYIPGNTYIDATGYVEYRAGNLPIVISSPHGGYLEPASIPDRNCTGCVTIRDSFTQEVTRGVDNAILAETGCYPHVIINLLHRKKFDANRDVGDAANGDPTVIQSWNNYHNFIDAAKAQIIQDYGTGTFYDMHGHGHTIQRIELGYLLTSAELQQTDNYLNTNTAAQDNSIRTLSNSNQQNLTLAQLLRGTSSFGDIIANRGFHAVPSSFDPAPQGTEPYFAGGYNTRRHGSSDNTSQINAIQIELNSNLRFNSTNRDAVIDSLALSMIDFHTQHYDSQFTNQYCAVLNNTEIKPAKNTSLYPNPSQDNISILTDKTIISYSIYDVSGKLIVTDFYENSTINISQLTIGLYFLTIQSQDDHKETLRFVKAP
ncbi:MAG: T9SS type A sorting domain-containing protein [Nonlabens sp.]|uniref:T9SS type A sorting domain-containing protein n=1 Tax=Nonlabens sp. TaxID=1888209 RepID=UPI003EF36D1A